MAACLTRNHRFSARYQVDWVLGHCNFHIMLKNHKHITLDKYTPMNILPNPFSLNYDSPKQKYRNDYSQFSTKHYAGQNEDCKIINKIQLSLRLYLSQFTESNIGQLRALRYFYSPAKMRQKLRTNNPTEFTSSAFDVSSPQSQNRR